jgi:hypothetical protein
MESDGGRVRETARRHPGFDRAKSVVATTVGTLVVSLTSFVLPQVVRMVEAWVQNRPVRSVKLTVDDDELEITRVSRADQSRIITAFLERHGEG